MMNKVLPLILLIIGLSSCSDKGFVINGHLKGASEGSIIYLDKLSSTALESFDSVKVNSDGYFMIEGSIEMPEFFVIKYSNESFLTALVEPDETLTIEAYADSLSNPEFIDGSPGTQSMIDFNKRLREAVTELGKLSEIYNQNIDSKDLDIIMADLDLKAQNILSSMSEYTRQYIDKNLSSMVAMVALYQQVSPGIYVLNPADDLDYFKKVDSSLYSLYPESDAIIAFHEQITTLLNSVESSGEINNPFEIGDQVPDFIMSDKDGNEVSLYSRKGKVVLLDFWAAWCPPCRAENPNLVKVYNKFKSNGFDIFQVSLDQTREAWINGIEEDNLGEWTHVSDLKYWESKVVPLYKLESIPTNYLLDREGRVIAINLRGTNLEETLNELFNQ